MLPLTIPASSDTVIGSIRSISVWFEPRQERVGVKKCELHLSFVSTTRHGLGIECKWQREFPIMSLYHLRKRRGYQGKER